MNPNILAVAAALRGVLIAAGALLVGLNLGSTHTYALVMQASGAVMVVIPLAWSLFTYLVTLKQAIAAAVQAGINLTLSGKAVDHAGNPISKFAPDASPPKDVTVTSAAQIVKDYAPPQAEIAKS